MKNRPKYSFEQLYFDESNRDLMEGLEVEAIPCRQLFFNRKIPRYWTLCILGEDLNEQLTEHIKYFRSRRKKYDM